MDISKLATKNELKEEIASAKEELRQEISAVELRLRTEMDANTKRIIEHFNVVAEQIHSTVSSANADEISQIKDEIGNHEQRIKAIENQH